MRKTPLAVASCVIALGALAGCGDDADTAGAEPDPTPEVSASVAPSASASPASPSASPTPAPTGTVIDATIRGNDLEPNGERVKARLGEKLTLNIDSDRAGELHVHSVPEQVLKYGVGQTTLSLKIDNPGIVVVEDHDSEKVLVSLQVS